MVNKKIFHVGSEFDLTKKPVWLDDFRSKYDKPYRYHVTLKTSTYFDVQDFENLKNELATIAKRRGAIKIIFDKLFMGASPKGQGIMIEARSNKDLLELQSEIVTRFSGYGKHIAEQYKEFEKNFRPHITIARHLTPEQLEKAKKDLGEDLVCEAWIKELVLTTASNDSFDELSDPRNKIVFKLKKVVLP